MSKNSVSALFALIIILFILLSTASANTTISDQFISVFGELLTKDAPITIGTSGAVDYRTTDYPNDTACIQAALDNAQSGDKIIIREGTYNITSQVTQYNKNLEIEGSGNVTFRIDTGVASEPAFYFSGSEISDKTLTTDASKNDRQITIDDASDIKVSDLVKIYKDTQWCPLDYPAQTTGELYVIEDIQGNTLTLNQPLLRDYTTASTTAKTYRPASIKIDNIRFVNSNSTGDLEGLALKYCKDSKVTNSEFKDNGQASIRIYTCYNVEIKDNIIKNSERTGRGYGISIADASASIIVQNNQIENCRHLIMSGTAQFEALNRAIVISDNMLIGSNVTDANVIDAHPMTIDYTVTGNIIYPTRGYYAFYDGTQQSTFSDNYVYGGGGVKRRGSVNGTSHIIADNHVEGGEIYHSSGYGLTESIIISGNYDNDNYYGVAISSENFKNIQITGNTFINSSENAIYLIMESSTPYMNTVISGNIIRDIHKNGIYVKQSADTNTSRLVISDNIINNVNLDTSTYNGIYLVDFKRADIHNNQIIDDADTMNYGIREYGTSDWNYIHDNVISGGSGYIDVIGANTTSRNNIEIP